MITRTSPSLAACLQLPGLFLTQVAQPPRPAAPPPSEADVLRSLEEAMVHEKYAALQNTAKNHPLQDVRNTGVVFVRCVIIEKFVIEDETKDLDKFFGAGSARGTALKTLLQRLNDPKLKEPEKPGVIARGAVTQALATYLADPKSEEKLVQAVLCIRRLRLQFQLRRYEDQSNTTGKPVALADTYQIELGFKSYLLTQHPYFLNRLINQRLWCLGLEIGCFLDVARDARNKPAVKVDIFDDARFYQLPAPVPFPASRPNWKTADNFLLVEGDQDRFRPGPSGITFLNEEGVAYVFRNRSNASADCLLTPIKAANGRVEAVHNTLRQAILVELNARKLLAPDDRIKFIRDKRLLHVRTHELGHCSMNSYWDRFSEEEIFATSMLKLPNSARNPVLDAQELLAELSAIRGVIETGDTAAALLLCQHDLTFNFNDLKDLPDGALIPWTQNMAGALLLRAAHKKPDGSVEFDFEKAKAFADGAEKAALAYIERFRITTWPIYAERHIIEHMQRVEPVTVKAVLDTMAADIKRQYPLFSESQCKRQAIGVMLENMEHDFNPATFSQFIAQLEKDAPKLQADVAKALGFEGKTHQEFMDYVLQPLAQP